GFARRVLDDLVTFRHGPGAEDALNHALGATLDRRLVPGILLERITQKQVCRTRAERLTLAVAEALPPAEVAYRGVEALRQQRKVAKAVDEAVTLGFVALTKRPV